MNFTEVMDRVAQLFELIGAVVLLVGLFVSAGLAEQYATERVRRRMTNC